jgi:putative oxidoreductase
MTLSKVLSAQAERVFVILRVVCGALMALHGLQKFGVLGKFIPPMWSQLWFGAWIELIGGVLVMLGLLTAPAALILSGTMAVAYTQFHWKLQLGAGFFPGQNGGELALVYCLVFLYIACHGPGPFSLDRQVRRR